MFEKSQLLPRSKGLPFSQIVIHTIMFILKLVSNYTILHHLKQNFGYPPPPPPPPPWYHYNTFSMQKQILSNVFLRGKITGCCDIYKSYKAY